MSTWKEIATKYFPDYPDLENAHEGILMHCIGTGIQGLMAANKDLHEKIGFLERNCQPKLHGKSEKFIIDGVVCDAELEDQLKMKIHGQESIDYIISIIGNGIIVPLTIGDNFIGPIKFIKQYSFELDGDGYKSIGVEFLKHF